MLWVERVQWGLKVLMNFILQPSEILWFLTIILCSHKCEYRFNSCDIFWFLF